MKKHRIGWGWALLTLVVGFNVGQCSSSTAHADAKTYEARALERIARALEGKCKP